MFHWLNRPHFYFYFFLGAGQLESVHLSAPFVAVKNKEVNLTVVLWPSQVGTVTYIWWFGNNSEVNSPCVTHWTPVHDSVCLRFYLTGCHVNKVGIFNSIRWQGILLRVSFTLCSQPVITLEGSVAFTFSREGISVVTVQVSAGNNILQDRKTVAVHGEFN